MQGLDASVLKSVQQMMRDGGWAILQNADSVPGVLDVRVAAASAVGCAAVVCR